MRGMTPSLRSARRFLASVLLSTARLDEREELPREGSSTTSGTSGTTDHSERKTMVRRPRTR